MDEIRSNPNGLVGDTRASASWISDTSYWIPRHLVESAWLEHAPFAFWLVDAIRPTAIAELGTHNGFSYFVFCEAIDRLGLPTKSLALDSWEGDDQAGFYGADVYERVSKVNESDYARFSTLLRGYFDDSLDSIPDGSIDLLHIDGRHGYDDVRHDFQAWRPKLTDRGVVVFHDIAEHQEGFGVWRFWKELTAQYPSFAFDHGHGLGVLAVGDDVPDRLHKFLEVGLVQSREIKDFYELRGAAIGELYDQGVRAAEVPVLKRELDSVKSELDAVKGELEAAKGDLASANAGLEVAGHQSDEQDRLIAVHANECVGLLNQIKMIHQSMSWKVTRPLRLLSAAVRRPRG